MVIFGFSSFIKNCPNSDEIRPSTNQCIQNFGFQSTFFESLEALYVLKLTKSFNYAKNIISSYFKNSEVKPNEFKNIILSRSELYDRAVASLIGTYIISKDQLFLNMAEQLTDSIIFLDSKTYFPYPFYNFIEHKGFERSWENGTSIIDIVSGLPEILSLYKITKKEKYLDFVMTLLKKLKKSNSLLNENGISRMFIFYNAENGQNETNDFFNDRNFNDLAYVYENLLRSYYLSNLEELKEFIPYSILSGHISNDIFFDSYQFLNYLNNSMHNSAGYNLQSEITEKFEFDATFVRNNLRKMSYSYQNKQEYLENKSFEGIVTEFLNNLLDETEKKCKSSSGYSGLSFSNSKKQRQNNIQHSSFFGNWMNIFGHALEFNLSFWNHALFNARGHLLYL